ncbi:hypothetical protein BGZ98_001398, partial [Dissophora globulifera]
MLTVAFKTLTRHNALFALALALVLLIFSSASASPPSYKSFPHRGIGGGLIIAPKTVATTESNVITHTDVTPKVSIEPTVPIPYSVPYTVPVPVGSAYPYPVPTAAF